MGAPVLFSPTHLPVDDHAPSALKNYKISSPLENYSCQYNSTIGGLMAVTESKISEKKTTTQLFQGQSYGMTTYLTMYDIIQKHP